MVDIGSGDGRFVVERARADPGTLAIGVEPDVRSLRTGIRRIRRERLPNAVFIVSSLERIPLGLAGIADEVFVHFPWGSLLDGLLAGEPVVMQALARLGRSGGALTVLASVVGRDQQGRLVNLDEPSARDFATRAARFGLVPARVEVATARDIASSHSTWAKRLGVGRLGPAWVWTFCRV